MSQRKAVLGLKEPVMDSLSDPRSATASRKRGWFDVARQLTELAGTAVADALAARRSRRSADEAGPAVVCSLAIKRPPHEVYAFYRRLSQLPLFMDYLHSVREADSTYSHWVARLPAGGTIAWDTKITEDRPGELIAWRSVEGSLIDVRGRVMFAATPRRNVTEVRIELQLASAGTRASRSVATLFTWSQIEHDLQRLAQLLETASAASRAGESTAAAHFLPEKRVRRA
jgi:uncharacterized membrane protein